MFNDWDKSTFDNLIIKNNLSAKAVEQVLELASKKLDDIKGLIDQDDYDSLLRYIAIDMLLDFNIEHLAY